MRATRDAEGRIEDGEHKTPNAARNWVLRTPCEAPDSHWRIAGTGRTVDAIHPRRRPSTGRLGIPEAGRVEPNLVEGAEDRFADLDFHRTMNELRRLLTD